MDFELTEEQQELAALTGEIFADKSGVDRLGDVERSPDGYDRALWSVLAGADLLGMPVPTCWGGSGAGVSELCVLLEQQGRFVAPVPLWSTLAAGVWPISRYGSVRLQARWLPGVVSGEVILASAVEDGRIAAVAQPDGSWLRLAGTFPAVPAASVAAAILIPVRLRARHVVVVVDASAEGVEVVPTRTTDRQPAGHVVLHDVRVDPSELLGGPDSPVEPSMTAAVPVIGLCAVAVGVAGQAVRMAAAYTSERTQFGRPLSTFQAVAHRAADAYIDTECMRVTMWQAAWRVGEGYSAVGEVAVAKWWASVACHRVVHASLHVHGGIGNDVSYPLHRYFLWGQQLAGMLGGSGLQRARIGSLIAEGKLGPTDLLA